MLQKKWFFIVAIAVTGLTVQEPAPQAQGSIATSVDASVAYPVSTDSAAEARPADLAVFAQEQGRPLVEVLAEQAGSEEFAVAVAKLRELFPGDFSGAALADDSGEAPWVSFVGEVPPGVAQILATVPRQVRVRAEASISEAERDQVLEAVTAAVRLYLGDDFLIGMDTQIGVVDIHTDEVVGSEVIQVAIDAAQPYANEPIRVGVVAEEGATDFQVLSGGTALGRNTSSVLECTSAFTVNNIAAGNSGLLTASHCDDWLNYETRPVLTFQGHGEFVNLDIQWHSSAEAIQNAFI